MMTARLAIAATLAALLVAGPAALAQTATKPSESIWKPAPTPPGGVAWAVLEAAKEDPAAAKAGAMKPLYPATVKSLAGKRVKINGYMLPLGKGANQSHFVLLAYPPDCPFHLNPGPQQFIEVKVASAIPMNYDVRTIEGTLQLAGGDGAGVFYKISDGKEM
ncbi:DUF3299 domain-containing protein [Sandarakinorhabdus sp.]|uniref:DUF3299 domain-containing protein n=1 Tax=Sandarakinorhabdus sp. TaxID=1916663 RepID=UPI00286DDB92|nr:DUF3299 domain-containing protein [Sandarakinorhabdus sp.]